MCDSQGCCHASMPGVSEVAAVPVKAAGAVAGAAVAVAAVSAALALVRAVIPAVVLGLGAATVVAGVLTVWRVRRAGGLWLAHVYAADPDISPGPPPSDLRTTENTRSAALPAAQRLAIGQRHVIPAWTDYETTEVSR